MMHYQQGPRIYSNITRHILPRNFDVEKLSVKFITVEVGFAAEKRIPKHLVNEMLMKIGFFIKGRGDVLSLYMTPQCGDIIDILMFWTHPFGHKWDPHISCLDHLGQCSIFNIQFSNLNSELYTSVILLHLYFEYQRLCSPKFPPIGLHDPMKVFQ